MHFGRQIAILSLALICASGALIAQATQVTTVTVDATQAQQKVLHVQLDMQVHPGPLTLLYPKWIPGMHEPAGPVANVTGLHFEANGQNVSWRRDLLDVFTFHVDIPAGGKQLHISFDYLEPVGNNGALDGMTSEKLMALNWNVVVLYPAGTPTAQLMYAAKLRLPQGWGHGTALQEEQSSAAAALGGVLSFEPVSLTRLIDSPLVAGQYFRAVDITPAGEPVHHEIDVVAESEAALAMPDDFRKGMTNVVAESRKLFGDRHYNDYHFLLTLSDHTAHFGVEHHESNDSRLGERFFLTPDLARDGGALLAHEFAHSWSGKFRRPGGEDVPDYQAPMKTDLLWVYEGGASYFGDLLSARSGLWTPQVYREALASYAANLGVGRPGRTWRSVLDTAAAVPGMFGNAGWLNWRRGSDYYEEGELIWLEIATIMHDQSHGRKSFDDFSRQFYGGPNRGPELKPYSFEDLVEALNQTVPYGWTEMLNARLNSNSAQAPILGIQAAGWTLEFTGTPVLTGRIARGITNTTFSLGFTLAADGAVSDTVYDGLAFKAGIAPGMKIAGVNGRVFTADALADAVKSTKDQVKMIELLVINDEYYRTCKIEYRGGEKFPHLTRISEKPDYLTELVKPLSR